MDLRRYSCSAQVLVDGAEVVEWLRAARLERYAEKFIEYGFETLEDLQVKHTLCSLATCDHPCDVPCPL